MTPEAYRRLKTLDAIPPAVRPAFEALLAYATAQGFQPYVVSAVRTCAEEASLTSTTVRRSWHVLGRAVDIELHARGSAPSISDAYQLLGAWWESQGGTWGGRWTELYPVPHPAGWCGPPDLAGDPCHFQWTEGHESVPESIWPRSVVECADVDRLQASYLRSQGLTWPLDASPATSSDMYTSPAGVSDASHSSVSSAARQSRFVRPLPALLALMGLALVAGAARGRGRRAAA